MAQATTIVADESLLESPGIQLERLVKCYNSIPVLNELDLQVQPNEFMVILGQSGCGKSTLLKLIAGLEPCDSGTIRIHGRDQSNNPPHKRDVAMVFQSGNGYEHLSVLENLSLASKLNPSQLSQNIGRWTDSLGLGSIVKTHLSKVSGGEAQRVALARAFLSGKSAVLFDEPLAHLDLWLRRQARELILNLHQESKKTFVYVTHDSEEAMYLASRIAVLAGGKIQQIGTPREIYESPSSAEVAMAIGNPAVNLIWLPQVWAGSAHGSTEAVCFGIRPMDWQVLEFGDVVLSDNSRLGLQQDASHIHLRGAIKACRWLGTRWSLSMDVANPSVCRDQADPIISLEISPVSPGPLDGRLRQAEDGGSPNQFGIHATVEKKLILTLSNRNLPGTSVW